MIRRSAVLVGVAVLSVLGGCGGPSSLEEAESAYLAGDYDRAIAWSSKSIDQEAGPSDAYLIRGKCYEKKGEHIRAIADYEVARQDAPDRGEPDAAQCARGSLMLRNARVTSTTEASIGKRSAAEPPT